MRKVFIVMLVVLLMTVGTVSAEVLIDDFEEQLVDWSSAPRSTLALVQETVYSGQQALIWTYDDDDVARWQALISKTFAPMDWSEYSTLQLYFKADGANPIQDAGKTIFFNLYLDGEQHKGAVDSFDISREDMGNWRCVQLDITGVSSRDKVTGIMLFVDGKQFMFGEHLWYIDRITLRK